MYWVYCTPRFPVRQLVKAAEILGSDWGFLGEIGGYWVGVPGRGWRELEGTGGNLGELGVLEVTRRGRG